MKQRSSTLTAALALCAVMLSGCASEMPAPAGSATPTETPVPLAPLRGTVIDDGEAQNPSLAAKIDNHEAARPQIGLESTDIVFEQLVEGGLTRYVAIWQSTVPDEIGPIRSIRPMDPDIIAPFGGIVAYSGGQDRFIEMMQATDVVNAVHGQSDTSDVMYRTKAKRSPHNVVVKAEELVALHDDLAAPAQQFAYAEKGELGSAATAGEPTEELKLRFSQARFPSWSWDAASARFLRSQEGAPDLDENGTQLAAANVLTLRVTIDHSFTDVPNTVMVGSGEAWVSGGGRTLHAEWSKASQTAPIVLTDDAGAPIALDPGNTWIELVPLENGAGVEIVPPAA